MGASEIESFMAKNYETCIACKDLKDYVSSILDHCIEHYSNNPYIIDYKERLIHAQECTHNLQEPVEEEIAEPESSLDEKEEESDEQREEEWISYPCLPSNESNSLSLTLFDCPPCLPKEDECYVPVDSLEIFPMSKTCENNYATVTYDNPCYFDKSYVNPLFVADIEMHGTKEFCLEKVYDKALDDGPMLLDNINCTTNENGIGEVLTLSSSPISFDIDQSSCYKIVTCGFESFNPTICELDKIYVFVDHEKHALCDSYIVEFIHDATENYYERGKYGCRNFHGAKTPLYMLKILKLLLFYLPMLVTLFFMNLFVYKFPLHRKWVRLKCVLNLLLDAPFASFSIFMRASLKLSSLAKRH
jgi:hypothetical protein